MTVPKRRDAAGLAFASQGVTSRGDDFGGIRANEQIRAFGNGDGAFGVFPEREAGDAESGGLFLDATGIGEDER